MLSCHQFDWCVQNAPMPRVALSSHLHLICYVWRAWLTAQTHWPLLSPTSWCCSSFTFSHVASVSDGSARVRKLRLSVCTCLRWSSPRFILALMRFSYDGGLWDRVSLYLETEACERHKVSKIPLDFANVFDDKKVNWLWFFGQKSKLSPLIPQTIAIQIRDEKNVHKD